MMSSMEERMTALEGDVAQIRQEWAVVAQAPLIQARLLNALRETQLEHGKELQEQRSMLNHHTADLAELKGDVAELKGDVAELKGDVAELKGDVAELKGDVAELKGDVAELKGDVAELKGDVSELKMGQFAIAQMLTTLIEREG
jgi:chromosome segregation ATPase